MRSLLLKLELHCNVSLSVFSRRAFFCYFGGVFLGKYFLTFVCLHQYFIQNKPTEPSTRLPIYNLCGHWTKAYSGS